MELPNELLIRILLSVEDDVDRYCLGLSCIRLFSVCEDVWLKKYTDAFKRPRLLVVARGSAWESIPQNTMHHFRPIRSRQSTIEGPIPEQPASEAQPYDAICKLARLPSYTSEAVSDPLVVLLRQLGERVRERMFPSTSSDGRDGMPSDFTDAPTASEAAATFRTEASVLSRSLLSHIPTPTQPSPLIGQPKVLRNHSKKLFVLEGPLCSVYRQCFGKQVSPNFSYMVCSRIFIDSRTFSAEWVGDALDVVSEAEFCQDLEMLTVEERAQWENFSGKAMEGVWELGKQLYRESAVTDEKEVRALVARELGPGKTVEELLNRRRGMVFEAL